MDYHVDIATTPAAFEDTTSNARSVKDFANAINHVWRKSAGDFIACGRLLGEANDELPRDAFNAMVKSKLDFVSSVARKLIRIAANQTLCSPGNKLPPAWTILYQLSQLPEDVLKAAIADGRVHPGMSRAEAAALNPKKTAAKSAAAAAVNTAVPTNSTDLNAAWTAASPGQRQALLDQLGREGLCAAMSSALMVDFRDHLIDLIGSQTAGAAKYSHFAIFATKKLTSAFCCAEQPEPDTTRIVALLNCILKNAKAKGIALSDVVIAEGRAKGREK
jgi:hypothetical protein